MNSSPSALRMQLNEPGAAPILSFADIFSALSFAIDLTEDAVPGHAVRSCILGMRIAQEIKLPEELMAPLYYALLLKDAGCSNNAARMSQIVGGDDRAMKNGAKLEDWTKPYKPTLNRMRLLWNGVLPNSNAIERLLRILNIGLTQHRNNAEMIALRCERGAAIARKLGLSPQTAKAIYSLDEHWDGSGYPERKMGKDIPILARILAVAQHLDLFACERTPQEALKALIERGGTWFDPRLVSVVLTLAREYRLWPGCLPDSNVEAARQIAVSLEPGAIEGGHAGIFAEIQSDEIDRICEAFADVVDAKSPFTYRHSMGVADVANQIAVALNLPPDRLLLVRRAALLHDLGKLAVSNTILDKASKLNPEEWAVVVEHPRLTREILARIKPFQEIAVIAGAHHERLDGSGYPDKLKGDQLCLEARLIAVADFYRALTEDRPYRAGMTHEAAMAILRKELHALDVTCVDALDHGRTEEYTIQSRKTAQSEREPRAANELVASVAS